jgi:hypothetical protein
MTDSKVHKFIKICNETIHQSTGISSDQMQSNKNLEVQYIIESLNKQNKIETSTPNGKLNVNDKARLIEPKKALKKARYNVSPCYDTIY